MLKRLDELQKALQNFQEELKMSNYGPKRGGQYTPSDNARRKANNTGDQTGFGQNTNTKSYSTKPGQLSSKAQANAESAKYSAKNRAQPVKIYTPEEKAKFAAARGYKAASEDGVAKQEEVTTPHGQHDPGPLPGKAPLPVQIDDEKKKLKADGKTVELLDFSKSGQWSLKTK